jgi:hypothetical protein
MIIPLTVEDGGLRITAVREGNTPGFGETIAHDIVEHVNGFHRIGGIEDELEALGGVWMTRGHCCDLRRPNYSIYSPEANIASDLTSMAEDYWNGRKLKFVNSHGHIMDESFECIVDIFKEKTLGISMAKREQFGYVALRLMRSGARKLCRRFKRFDYRDPENAANQLYWAIAEAIPNDIRLHEYEEEYALKIVGLDATFIRKEIRY